MAVSYAKWVETDCSDKLIAQEKELAKIKEEMKNSTGVL